MLFLAFFLACAAKPDCAASDTHDVDAPCPPDIAINHSEFDFGEIAVGSKYRAEFLLYNLGCSDIHISDADLESSGEDFRLGSLNTVLILPDGNGGFPVTFAPQSTGILEGTVSVDSDDPDEPTLTLELTGEGI